MLHHKKTVLIAVLAVTLLAALPALAANASINDISRAGCVISVTYTVSETGSYSLDVYDSGALVANYAVNALAGTTILAQHTVSASTSSLALLLTGSSGEILDGLNGYTLPAAVVDNCAQSSGAYSGEPAATVQAAADSPCPIPSGSVVGDLPFATPAYWAPGKLTSPVVTVNPGTYWVVGTDSTGDYYQIYLSCQLMWVPVDSMQPTFQSPWNGQALPTRSVE